MSFCYTKIVDKDGSVVISSDDTDVISAGRTEQEALSNFVNDLIEYAREFSGDFEYWSSAPNRKKDIPIVLQILAAGNEQKIRNMLRCSR